MSQVDVLNHRLHMDSGFTGDGLNILYFLGMHELSILAL